MQKCGSSESAVGAPLAEEETERGSAVMKFRQRSARFPRMPNGRAKTRNQEAWLRPMVSGALLYFCGEVKMRIWAGTGLEAWDAVADSEARDPSVWAPDMVLRLRLI